MLKKRARIIGVPMDLGAGHRGVDMGPFAVRIAGLTPQIMALGYEVEDDGNVPVKIQEQMDSGDPKLRFLPQIVEVCRELAEWVEEAADAGDTPIVIGGDHSIAMGSLGGLSASYRKRSCDLGLIWFDAHADFNTPGTTTSGNIHGMPFAVLMGYGAPELTQIGGFSPKFHPDRVALIGIRSVDPEERDLVKRSGIAAYTMREVDERGLPVIMREALARVTAGSSGFAASIDMDCFDPGWSHGVGTPVTGGLSYREAHMAMEMIADTGKLCHVDLVEINPIFDSANQTSEMGVELVLSALGKRIL
ncbi:MAG: arginase [Acidobacteria bacterium]|nr:arginase [Acidobacteriota bacterium]